MVDYIIREAEEKDFRDVALLYERCEFGLKKEKWIKWKYMENPLGRGHLFVVESKDKQILGTFGIIPSYSRIQGESRDNLFQAVDAILAPEIRGGKIYPKLLEYSTEHVEKPVIGFPNEKAEPIHIKFGYKILAPLERWYLPVDMSLRIRGKIFAWLVKLLNNSAIATYHHLLLGKIKPNIEMIAVTQFNISSIAGQESVFGIGYSSEYLNWRFVENPTSKFLCFVFQKDKQPIGYCVAKQKGHTFALYDFYSKEDLKQCVKLMINFCKSNHISHIVMQGAGMKLGRFGFFRHPVKKRNVIALNFESYPGVIKLSESDW